MSKKDILVKNNIVLSLFRLYDTTGYPLDMAIHFFRSNDMDVSIPHFINDARKAGWRQEKIESILRQACLDTGLDIGMLDKLLSLESDKLSKVIDEWNAL